ncbi:MAG: glycosyltransferase family A protein [Candidatus Omnitrophota bacterium]|nr:glycosyltransferase family A protein [Candidatus Omnitrophota bacterium]
MKKEPGVKGRISAVVTAFNSEKYLERAVESLVNTGYPDLEIVIVDDGSRDSSMNIAKMLTGRHPGKIRIFQHRNGANRGVSASRNLGILESSGEYICFLDADDRVFPHRFETAVSILEKDASVDGVYELARMVFETEADQAKWADNPEFFGLSFEEADHEHLLGILLKGTSWASSAILFRRALLSRTGLFNEKQHIAEDCNLWFRMASVGLIIAGNMREPVSAYFRHDSNTYFYVLERKKDMISAMIDFYKWSKKKDLPHKTNQTIREGVSNYIINSLIATREAKKPALAWRIAIRSFLGAPSLCLNKRFFAQMMWMLRGK